MDNEIFNLITLEGIRQESHLELIASENYASPQVRRAMGSCLTNKYAEGYPGHRYYGGCEYVDMIEDICRDRACTLFGAEHANVQPHSGSQANMAAYMAFLKPGDTVLAMDLNCGGHLTHGAPVSFSGKLYDFHHYGVDTHGDIDYDMVRDRAQELHPRMIVAGASAYPRKIDFQAFKEICDEVGAYFMVDMAHIAGLVAAGIHESPVPYADVVTTTTHKTLRGPRGGMILCKSEYAKYVDNAVFPRVQGGPLMHVIAAKAVCLHEAMQPEFVRYQKQVCANAKAMEDGFFGEHVNMVTYGTDNHLLLLDLTKTQYTGKALEDALDSVGITVNKNMIPNDPRKPNETSGIRIGTPAITTRGLDENECYSLARSIGIIINNGLTDSIKQSVRELVVALCAKHPVP